MTTTTAGHGPPGAYQDERHVQVRLEVKEVALGGPLADVETISYIARRQAEGHCKNR
jgi:hypothetical protein